jgi:hypothetical protein
VANSYIQYVATGAVSAFVVPFPYLYKEHVTVTVNGVITPFTWSNDSLVQLPYAPDSGAVVSLVRSSNPDSKLITYTSGSVLTDDQLNLAYTHDYYLAQEALDRLPKFLEDGLLELEGDTVQTLKDQLVTDVLNSELLADLQADLVSLGELETTVLELSDTVYNNTSGYVTSAELSTEITARQNGDSANAASLTTLSTTVGGHTTTLQTYGASINGLNAQYTVKINNNGYVSGYGLASTVANGTPTSTFIVLADSFAVVTPGVTPKVPFVAGVVNGVSGVGINGQLLVDGSIYANVIAGNTITANKLSVNSLSAITGNMGQLTTGKVTLGTPSGVINPMRDLRGNIVSSVNNTSFTRTTGAAWDACVFSAVKAVGACYIIANISPAAKYSMIGLAAANTNVSYTNLAYGILVASNNSVYIYENGAQVSEWWKPYAPLLSIGGSMTTTDNVNYVKAAGAPTAWESAVYMTATSSVGINAVWKRNNITGYSVIGLSANPAASNGIADIVYAIHTAGNQYYTVVNGVFTLIGAYVATDTFSIVYQGGAVKMYRNSVQFGSVGGVSGSYGFDSSFYEAGTGMQMVSLSTREVIPTLTHVSGYQYEVRYDGAKIIFKQNGVPYAYSPTAVGTSFYGQACLYDGGVILSSVGFDTLPPSLQTAAAWSEYSDTDDYLLWAGKGAKSDVNAQFYVKRDGAAKFAGALSAASGTFAGQLVAASGTFSGDITGSNGTFSGTLNAATVNAVQYNNIPRGLISNMAGYVGTQLFSNPPAAIGIYLPYVSNVFATLQIMPPSVVMNNNITWYLDITETATGIVRTISTGSYYHPDTSQLQIPIHLSGIIVDIPAGAHTFSYRYSYVSGLSYVVNMAIIILQK